MVWELNIATSPPLAQCHLLATTKRCDRPKDVTPVMGLEPATPEPHAKRQRTELRPTRGTNRAATVPGERVGDLGVGRLADWTPQGAKPRGVTHLIG